MSDMIQSIALILKGSGNTRRAQAPLKRKLSKSAKGRLKKRLRKERSESENGNRE